MSKHLIKHISPCFYSIHQREQFFNFYRAHLHEIVNFAHFPRIKQVECMSTRRVHDTVHIDTGIYCMRYNIRAAKPHGKLTSQKNWSITASAPTLCTSNYSSLKMLWMDSMVQSIQLALDIAHCLLIFPLIEKWENVTHILLLFKGVGCVIMETGSQTHKNHSRLWCILQLTWVQQFKWCLLCIITLSSSLFHLCSTPLKLHSV